MKKVLTILLVFVVCYGNSQDINYRRKFFSFHEARFSLGIGGEYAFSPALAIPLVKPSDIKALQKDPRNYDSAAYYSYGLFFDLYSENSIVGILFGGQMETYNIGFEDEDANVADFSKISRISLPAYLKFRFGKILRADGRDRSHFLFMLGGAYNIPTKIDRKTSDLTYNDVLEEDKSIKQLKSNITASTIIGYEVYLQKAQNIRSQIYLRASYDITNQFNNNYPDYQTGGTSALSNYQNFDVRQLNLTFGIKLFFRFKKSALQNNTSTLGQTN